MEAQAPTPRPIPIPVPIQVHVHVQVHVQVQVHARLQVQVSTQVQVHVYVNVLIRISIKCKYNYTRAYTWVCAIYLFAFRSKKVTAPGGGKTIWPNHLHPLHPHPHLLDHDKSDGGQTYGGADCGVQTGVLALLQGRGWHRHHERPRHRHALLGQSPTEAKLQNVSNADEGKNNDDEDARRM